MPKVRKLVFFGSPEFALPTLEALCKAGRTPHPVVSRPARAAGRGRKLKQPPVAAWAAEHGLEVWQPESVREPRFLAELDELEPDLAVVVAFGQIFPAELLKLPRHGCVNLHASLLPRYRGAAPVQAAISNGERKTGVTVMQMEEELDAGPILLQEETSIGDEETAGELSARLAGIGAELLLEAIVRLEKGKLKPRKQSDESATYAPTLKRENGKINWALNASEIFNRLRAYTPWPGLFAYFRGRPVKILEARPVDWELAPSGSVGTYLGLRQGRMAVLCGDSTILGIETLQRPGRKAIRPSEFAQGERLRVGDRFA